MKRQTHIYFSATNRFVILFLLAGWWWMPIMGQESAESLTERIIADIYEQVAENSEEEIDFTTFFDDLYQYAQTPINLNRATKEDLERLPFLTAEQIDNILFYVYRYGPMQTIYELQLIDGLASYDIRNMLPFVQIGESEKQEKPFKFREMFQYGKHEVLWRLDRGVETREGYRYLPEEEAESTETNSKKYVGNPFYTSLKYRFHYQDKVYFGLSAEKDAGEQFWGQYNKGFDFYAGFLQINNIWRFRQLVAGDFRANFGQGLVLRNELSFGKSSYVLNVGTRNNGLKKYSSTDEYNFFRGAGATIQLGKFDLTAFYSNKKIDASVENNTFASIYKTGLHRTQSELDKKYNVRQQVMGGNVTFTHKSLQVGLTVSHFLLSDTLKPATSTYNIHYFSGIRQTVGGVNYRFKVGKLNFFGETAMTDKAAVATLNGLRYTPISQVGLVALYRWYSPRYDNMFASAFGETSRINNESGLYIGAEVRPIKRWKFAAYADGYTFRFPKYGTDRPSTGFDYLLQADFAVRRNISMYWRVKWEQKESNISGTGSIMPTVGALNKASLRYNLVYNFGQFSFKNQLEVNLAQKGDSAATFGFIASQDISYQLRKIPMRFDFRFQIFDASNYENRFYSYERDVLYAFSIPSYYGIGGRYYLNISYHINQHFSIWLKIAQTAYADDRESMSSSNEAILGNRKTDIRMLVRAKF